MVFVTAYKSKSARELAADIEVGMLLLELLSSLNFRVFAPCAPAEK
jgi:hypothetical protein